MDFVSQLIEQKVIEKYYIYLPAFFDEKGKYFSDLYLTLGMFPNILDNYYNQTSYAPLNTKYPKKWSLILSHIIYTDEYNSENPVNKTFSIYADVIFTNSGGEYITLPLKYKDIFDDIFISYLNCEVVLGDYRCYKSRTDKFKLFFVFNGFSHLLSNELISDIVSVFKERNFNIKYDNDIDFIAIDTYTFGNYHILFDGEENFILLMNKNKNNISDVSDICGYENRDRKQRKTHDKEYLLEWEERLKNESKKINETLEEIEKMKAESEKERKTLEEEIKLCKSDVLKQEVENLRKDLETKEKEKNEVINNLKSDLETKESDKTILNEQVSKNQTLMAMLIVQIILTALTFAILILFFCRVKRRENKIQNVEIGLVDKSIN